MKRVIFLPSSFEDIEDIAKYLRKHSFKSAERFLDSMEAMALSLAETPEIGTIRQFRHPELSGLRM